MPVNEYGFIETPFWKVENGHVLKQGDPIYLSADLEDECRVAPGDVATDSDGDPGRPHSVRYRRTEKVAAGAGGLRSRVQVISVATSLIPFLEQHDNRGPDGIQHAASGGAASAHGARRWWAPAWSSTLHATPAWSIKARSAGTVTEVDASHIKIGDAVYDHSASTRG